MNLEAPTAPTSDPEHMGDPDPEVAMPPQFMLVDHDLLAQKIAEALHKPRPKTEKRRVVSDEDLQTIDNNLASWTTERPTTETVPVIVPEVEPAPRGPVTEGRTAVRSLRGWLRRRGEAHTERVQHRERFYSSLGASALDYAYSPLNGGEVEKMEHEHARSRWERLYERVVTRAAESSRTYNGLSEQVQKARQGVNAHTDSLGGYHTNHMTPKRRRKVKELNKAWHKAGLQTKQERDEAIAESKHLHHYKVYGYLPKSSHEKQTAHRQSRRNWALNKVVGAINAKEKVKRMPKNETTALVRRQIAYHKNDWETAKKARRLARDEGKAFALRQGAYHKNDWETLKNAPAAIKNSPVVRGYKEGRESINPSEAFIQKRINKVARFAGKATTRIARANKKRGDRGGKLPARS